jgi:DNA repair protein RecO (recombination protein O)
MPPLSDQAVVLRHLDYSETSQVLACLTAEHGLRRLIAKGVKRATRQKPSTTIDLLEHGHVVFLAGQHADAGLATLTEWRQIDAHLGLRGRLPAWYAGLYAAEVTLATSEEADPHPPLFAALTDVLRQLAAHAPAMPTIAAYQCALLENAGLWPDFTRCVLCDKAAPPGRAGYYAAGQGGLVCRACAPGVPLRQYLPADLLDALRGRLFTEATAPPAFEVLNQTIAGIIGRPPVTATLVLA